MKGQPYPPRFDRKEIVFVRHAESQANVDGIWNGQTDGPLSDHGVDTLDALGRRLSDWEFDAVISSPLQRARLTAESFSEEVVIDDRFMEINMGEWEGKHFTEVQEQHGDELKAALEDRSIPFGGTGESLDQATKRALGAVDELFAKMGDNERVAVVTHGGFMQSVLHRHMAGVKGRVHSFTSNTGITRIYHQFGHPRLAVFNDTGHLGPVSKLVQSYLDDGDDVIALIRHGRTEANVRGMWQGQGDWGLDEVGLRQAESLGKAYGQHDLVYSSPLKRAFSTAQQVSLNGPIPDEDFMEVNMGEWEGLTTQEIHERFPGEMEKIFRDGEDLPRGKTGETWTQLATRFGSAIDRVEHREGSQTLVVAHGGAIRSYISSLTKTTDTHAESLFTPANTSVTHIARTDSGPQILDYAVATHLEDLE